MNFELLDSMTPEEANAALDRFVGIEKLAIEAMRGLGCADGFLHYGLESLAENLKWFLTQVRIKNVPIPLTEPEWVREGHKKGIQEFEED